MIIIITIIVVITITKIILIITIPSFSLQNYQLNLSHEFRVEKFGKENTFFIFLKL